MLQSSDEWWFIFEDDAIPSCRYPQLLPRVFTEAMVSDFDVVLLGHQGINTPQINVGERDEVGLPLLREGISFCTQGMLLRRSGAQKLVSYYLKHGVEQDVIDCWFMDEKNSGHMTVKFGVVTANDTYVSPVIDYRSNGIVGQRDVGSGIHSAELV